MTTTYTATAAREGRWWVITVDGVGVTQVRALRDAAEMARDLVATMLDVDPADVVVDVKPALDDVVLERVATAKRLVAELEDRQRTTAHATRAAAGALLDAGLTGADAATILGVSPQRVSQLALGGEFLGFTQDSAEKITAAKASRRKALPPMKA